MRRFWYFDVSKWSGETNLAFQCCANMVGWLQHGSILHGLNPQVTPKVSQAALTSQNTTQIYHDSPSDTPRHPQTSDTLDTIIYLQTFKVVRQYTRSWTRVEPTHHFWQNTEMQKTKSTWSFWDIKIPKPPHKNFLKIIGLGYFVHFLGSSERNYLLQLLWITL